MPDQATSENNWRQHRFDEMAIIVNERIDDPREADVEFYVGLEHLDSDSLTIRRWGSPSDVEATKLRFRAGDIIFGRRRVYQRKLAVATFNGICSAHAMVLRARPEVSLPQFLPFFMQSDLFMNRAKEISVGSLSPTINWKTLAKEQFALPPLKEQQRMVQALLAAEKLLEALRTVQASNRLLTSAVIDRLLLGDLTDLPTGLTQGLNVNEWHETTLGELCILSGGHGFRPQDWSEHGLPIIRIQNVRGSTDFNFYSGDVNPSWLVEPGTLLFSWAGVPGVSFGPGIWEGPKGVLNQHIFRVTPKPGVELTWLYEILRHLTPFIEKRAHGFKQSLLHIKKSDFTGLRVLLPPELQQTRIRSHIETMRRVESSITGRLNEVLRIKGELLAKSVGEQ